MSKRKGLGRGLDSLLSSSVESIEEKDRLTILPLADIKPGRYQPRSQMDDDSLSELAESIKAQGVIQPIIVRELGLSEYEIIAGERRWRASQLAGLIEVPAVIKNISDENALAIGLIENIQRQNLNPIEEALGLKRLVEEFGLTHERVAQAVGRSRSSISNSLRLLNLPDAVQDLLYARLLEMGHARALLSLPESKQIELALKAVKSGWSVREVERRIQVKTNTQKKKIIEVSRLESQLSDFLGMPVKIKYNKKGQGNVTFAFDNLEILQGLFDKLKFSADS